MNNTRIYNIDDIKNILEPVFKENGVRNAVLFGSYAKGIADEMSDIDILIDSGTNEKIYYNLLEYAKQAFDKKVDMFNINYLRASSKIEKEAYATGVQIYGDKLNLNNDGRIVNMGDEIKSRNIRALKKIIEYIEKIQDKTANINRLEFVTDMVLSEWSVFNLYQMCENANKIRDDFKNNYPDIKWHDIRGMRNRIAHEYEDVDIEIVWNIIENELGGLKQKLIEILNNEE